MDAVGAGDAFAAGWLSGLLDGRDETTRLRMGHYVASRSSRPLRPRRTAVRR
ncbi:PfkB family carbohydrate kinase [Streptomyces sp. M19]